MTAMTDIGKQQLHYLMAEGYDPFDIKDIYPAAIEHRFFDIASTMSVTPELYKNDVEELNRQRQIRREGEQNRLMTKDRTMTLLRQLIRGLPSDVSDHDIFAALQKCGGITDAELEEINSPRLYGLMLAKPIPKGM